MHRQTPEERFWSKVEKGAPDQCWIWRGKSCRKGYGRALYDGRDTGAHRVAWTIANGRWPQLFVLHSCDTPLCVNPAHLREGDQFANARDMAAKGRWANQFGAGPRTHCIHGHELTGENTMVSSGRRYCRACYRIKDARRRAAALGQRKAA